MTQFQKVNCSRGAPMGRHAAGNLDTDTPKSVRLFRVNLDSGGYDDGGAYWGICTRGESLFCAVDKDGDKQFTRARSREIAALLLEIPATALKRPLDRGTQYAFDIIDGKAPMPSGLDKSDIVEWLKRSGVPMGQPVTQ